MNYVCDTIELSIPLYECINLSFYFSAYPTAVGSSRGPSYPYHPYHVSYAPVSAQDSELQSLSSDALTDDTMSLTDSSV